MTKSEMVTKLRDKGAWLPGKTIKLDFGSDGVVLIDGVAGEISEVDAPADTSVRIDWADLQALEQRTLDPMTALMQGKLRIEGDMSNAMQLQSVISKLRT